MSFPRVVNEIDGVDDEEEFVEYFLRKHQDATAEAFAEYMRQYTVTAKLAAKKAATPSPRQKASTRKAPPPASPDGLDFLDRAVANYY